MSAETPSEPRIGGAAEPRERSWVPMVLAAGVVIVVLAFIVLLSGQKKSAGGALATNAAVDADAASIQLSNIVMSESANLAGGKVTYLDGRVANHLGRTVTGITVQVVFHNYSHEVVQNETLPLKLIRMREPYIDTESVAAAPLKPGSEKDFRLIFDQVSPDWDGVYPEVRVLHLQ